MTAPPTVCRIVLLQLEDGVAPAIVTGLNAGGGVDVVAFSDRWPLTAARVFRNVAHAEAVRLDHKGPTWLWPPRVDPPGGDVAKVSPAELELEQRAIARSIARLTERVTGLENAGHNARLGDAGDVATMFGLLERRLERLEARATVLERAAAGAPLLP
jgi:hypothetical protein